MLPASLTSPDRHHDERIAVCNRSPVLTPTDDLDGLPGLVVRIDVLSRIERYP